MSLSDEPAPRPVLLPVIIAAVFLTIFGVSVGLALGARARDRGAAAPTTAPAAPLARTAEPSPAAEPCRRETQAQGRAAGADGTLVQRRHIITGDPDATKGVSDVYVCADGRGRLFYHAKSGDQSAPWVEGDNAVFLDDVQDLGGDYLVRNPQAGGTYTYEVFADRLRITRPGGEAEVQRVRS